MQKYPRAPDIGDVELLAEEVDKGPFTSEHEMAIATCAEAAWRCALVNGDVERAHRLLQRVITLLTTHRETWLGRPDFPATNGIPFGIMQVVLSSIGNDECPPAFADSSTMLDAVWQPVTELARRMGATDLALVRWRDVTASQLRSVPRSLPDRGDEALLRWVAGQLQINNPPVVTGGDREAWSRWLLTIIWVNPHDFRLRDSEENRAALVAVLTVDDARRLVSLLKLPGLARLANHASVVIEHLGEVADDVLGPMLVTAWLDAKLGPGKRIVPFDLNRVVRHLRGAGLRDVLPLLLHDQIVEEVIEDGRHDAIARAGDSADVYRDMWTALTRTSRQGRLLNNGAAQELRSLAQR